MGNKIKDFVKSIMINASVAAFNLENKLVKNSDVENRSMTDGAINISKEHKNDVLNKLRRGERHEEFITYYYQLLKKADEVVIDENLFKKYKDNIDLSENFDFGAKDFHDKSIEFNDDNESKRYFENQPKKRERLMKFNEHYQFIKDIKFTWNGSDSITTAGQNIYFKPNNLTKNEISSLDFVRLRKFNDSELIIELWFNEETNLSLDRMSPLELVNNNILKNNINIINEDLIKDLYQITYSHYNDLYVYNLTGFLIKERINNNIIFVFKGNEQTTQD
jgi:hypothetical protein